AGDPRGAAEWDGLHAVLRLAPPGRPQPGTEAHEELLDLHLAGLRGEEVAGLVHDDDGDDREEEQQLVEDLGHRRRTSLPRASLPYCCNVSIASISVAMFR